MAPEKQSIHKNRKRNLPVEDPWHNWHKPGEASETEVAAVAEWQVQQHLQSALVSVVVAEPHHADLTLMEAPSRRGAMVTNEKRQCTRTCNSY